MTSKTLSELLSDEEEIATEVIKYLMHKHFPGWDRRSGEFDTFEEYSDWVGNCIDSIIIAPDDIRMDQ